MKTLIFVWLTCLLSGAQPIVPEIQSPPPATFFELVDERDREKAKAFYRKYLEVEGMPVVAAAEVAEEALVRTRWIVTRMLAGRPDVVEALVKNRMYLIIIGKDQLYCDMPEYSRAANPEYLNERVRGTGGRPTSFGEENVLSLPIDRYDDESIAVHEFCHTIDGALRSIDKTWSERRNQVFQTAMAKGLWKNTYAASNPGEFWAEIAQSYFDCNRVNNWNHGPIGAREQLREYDAESFEFVRATFNLPPEKDWRYTPARKLPTVTAPPARFKIDPYYTKFTWAREFSVVGREAGDAALLRANEIIRKMFAYRHDVLKALIADGWRLAVTRRGEKIPTDGTMLAVESGRDDEVIRTMAKTMFEVVARRPEDPDWDKRGRNTQQYELRVKRLDERFGKRIDEVHQAGNSSLSAADYWADGVAKYFGPERAALKQNDPDLHAIVHETMAYEGRVDWRYRQ